MTKRRGILYITGALLIAGPPFAWLVSSIPVEAPVSRPEVTLAADREPLPAQDLRALALRDPMRLVEQGREYYDRNIREYRCTLVKQERLGNKLTDVQEIEIRYRENPYAVYMLWKSNPDGARRALHMHSDDYVDERGRKLVRVEPNGAVARLFTKDIFLPLDGAQVRKESRRAIDEAGFRSTFELLEHYNAIAKERGVLDLKLAGTGEIDGRPTYVLQRDLPYQGADGPYPDARMKLHLDQEWLLPVAVYSYADHNEETLLGSYVFTDIEINPNFDELAFSF